MDIDSALLSLILGTIGTAGAFVSTVLAIIEIRRRLSAKTEARRTRVQPLLEEVVAVLRIVCDPDTDPSKLYECNVKLLELGSEESKLRAVLEKVCPTIDAKLLRLLSRIEECGYDSRKRSHPTEAMMDQNYNSQALTLKEDIKEWLKQYS
jgi:hypothetical protein